MKIFIADDDKIIRQGLKAIIEEKGGGYEIVGEASDGVEALDAIKNLKPDVLITDIKMPVLNGVELIRELEKLGLDISTIVLSGYEEYNYVRESMKHGAKDYLLKPVHNEVLLDLLKKIEKDIEHIAEIRKKSADLSEKVAESMELFKQRLLIELIEGNEPKAERLYESGIAAEGRFIISIISISGQYGFKKEIHSSAYAVMRELVKENVCITLKTVNDRNFLTICSYGDETILFFSSSSGQSDFDKTVHDVLDSIKENIESGLKGYNITIGISTAFQTIQGARAAYRQAKLAIERRFYTGCCKLISYNANECSYSDFEERQLNAQTAFLLNCVEIGEAFKSRRTIEQIMDKLYGDNTAPEQLRNICAGIIHKICANSQEFKDIADIYPSKGSNIFGNIKEVETFSELKSFISDALYDIVERMSRERHEKGLKIIEMAKEYIRKNYRESISLSSISDYVHLNHTYFSELFKIETGRNFVDYLIETRINAAKKLLAKADTKVYQVGQMVGYENPISFNQAFKKTVGITPAEYRKIIR